MTPEQKQQIKNLFDAAMELAPDDRVSFLARECNGDEAVRAAVEQLLATEAEAEGFLSAPAVDDSSLQPNSISGERIGPYELVREIGRGGMGVVYLAHRVDDVYQKQVAVKLVFPALETAEVSGRFERERRTLAKLDHPNIARIIDGGMTTQGWSYLAMDYVPGVPIDLYCAEQQLSLTERLRLFQQVCRAVEHAHQHQIIHRDLKPSNILITPAADGRLGTPKLLDFGIAKLLDAAPSDWRTRSALHFLTPDYASPEQLRGESVDLRSDVYSLGVLLYELLTGQRPFHFDQLSLSDMLRVVSEEEPERPSLRKGKNEWARRGEGEKGSGGEERQERPQETDSPSVSPSPLLPFSPSSFSFSPSQLSGDLDNIILLALRKEPAARYASVAALREDIERHLQHQPVLAREPTLRYRTERYVRRHRVGMAIVSCLLVGLLMALVAALVRARNARVEAQQARRMLYLTQMQQAGRQLEDGGFAEVRATLERWRPAAGAEDWRGFEWFYLWREAHRERLELRHSDWVLGIAFAPDGKRIASAGSDRLVKIWDAQTGQELLTHKGHTRPVVSIAFTPDNRWIASVGEDKQLRLWDARTGQKQWHLDIGGPTEYALAFAPDGATLAVVAQNSLTLVRTADGTRLFTVNLEMALQKVAFFPDGRRLVTSGQDNMLRVWDAATGQPLKSVRAHPGSFVFTVAVSPDGRWIASGGNDAVGTGKAARLWNAETLQEQKVLVGHTNSVRGVAFSPDSKMLVTASADQLVKLWDVATGRELRTWRGHVNRIRDVAFAPDGKTIASCSDDGTVKVWNVDPAAEPAELLTGHSGDLFSVAFAPDGKTAATGGSDLTVRLWDLATGQTLHTLRGHVGRILSVAFAPDGRKLLTGSEDCTFRLWDVASGQMSALYENHHPGGPAIAFLPHGQAVYGREMDGAYVLMDVRTGQAIRTFRGHARAVDEADFSPDGKWLLTRSGSETARIWDTTTGEERQRVVAGDLTDPNGTYCCDLIAPDGQRVYTWNAAGEVQSWSVLTGRRGPAFRQAGKRIRPLTLSVDGRWLVTLTATEGLHLWDTTTGRETATMACADCGPFARLSPDGKWLAAIAADNAVRVWDVATRREKQLLRGHTNEVLCLDWSPDSRHLVSGGTDNTARLWDVQTGKPVRSFPFKTHIGWVLFSPAGEQLMTQGNDAVALWDVATGQMVAQYDYPDVGRGPVLSAVFSPDGRQIATTTAGAATALWETASGQLLKVFRGEFAGVWNTRFSPDGNRLVSASWDKTARVWDTITGRELISFTGHKNPVTAADFSPDGKFVASGGDDRAIRLWEAATGREVRMFLGHTDAVRGVAFSADGRRLASASVDQTVRVWDVESGFELLTLRGHTDEVWGLAFAPDGRLLMSGSWDQTARLWRGASDQ